MTRIQRILVTGAGGFVCSNIIPVLLDYGYHVVALDRAFDASLMADWITRWPNEIEVHDAEITAIHSIKADAILHGAAVTAFPEDLNQTPEDNLRANLEPTLVALDWVRQHEVQRAIFVSSSAVFSVSTGELTEDTPTIPRGTYAVAKQTTETLIQTLHEEYADNVLTVRLGNIYGPNEQSRSSRPRTSTVNTLLNEAQTTGVLTASQDTVARDWTFAPDLGHALHQLLSRPKLNHSLYNLTSGERLTTLQMAQAIQSVLPHVSLNILEHAESNTASAKRRGWLSNQRLHEETGFDNWTSFEKAIRQVIAARQNMEAMT
ncbi:MAG: NAD(P)-dependent oxidoreductase [Anaerolineae bacterium]